MSAFKRAQQWATFARTWHLFDARWQNPYDSSILIKKYLTGLWKPVFHPMVDCGDHVVVINSHHIALPGDEWYKRVYFHHRGYAGTASWTLAWELHEKDDTLIVQKAVYAALDKNLKRRYHMQRLHIFPESNIPDDISANITNQIRPLRLPPIYLKDIPEDYVQKFPNIFDYPKDYVLDKSLLKTEMKKEDSLKKPVRK